VTPTGNNTTTVIDDNSLVVTEQDSETEAIVTNLTILPEGDDGFNALFASADGMISGEPSSEVDVQVDHENQTISIPVTDSNGDPVTMTVDLNTGETTYQAPEGHSYVFGVLTPDAVDDHPVGGDSSGYPATPRTPYIISVTPSTRSAVITWTIPYTTAENVYCELHIYNVATGERTTGRGRIQCPGHGRRTITIGDRGDSLSPNTEYLVRVRASNAQGQTSWSRAFRFRTQLVPYTP
jgi:hypothetical protein